VLNASGSFTIPAAASGVTEILVIPDTLGPVTIHGTPGLEILGGNGNVTVIDPTIIDLGGNGTTAGADAVTVTAADSPYLVMGGPGAVNSITGLGSGTIYGGVGGNLINLTGSSGSNLVISTASVPGFGDTVFAGSGTTSVDNVVGSRGEFDIGGSGNFLVQDLGTSDTISVGLGNASVSTAGSDALVFGGTGSLVVDASGGTGDTIVGRSGPMTVNASSASNLLVFGAIGGPGMDFIGGSGSATVVAHAGSDTVTGGSGPLDIVAASGDTLAASGSSAGTTLFGSANSDVTFTSGSVGSLTYVGLAGNETLNASGSSTNNVFWGGNDPTGSESIVGGSGNDLMIAGQATDTFTGGGGNNEFLFMNSILSLSGGSQTNVITDFLSSSTNAVLLNGLSTVSSATASGNTTVTLSDGTKIEFIGVTSDSQLTGHIFSS